MTKRKRTPSPSLPPRKRVIFEVPRSLLRFQAIARELARQSELLLQRAANPEDGQLNSSDGLAHSTPQFDAQAFQTNALTFSPYSHQPFLPSQPWPQTLKSVPTSSDPTLYVEDSASLAVSKPEAAPEREHGRQISMGPDDQLFDELNDALHADEDEGAPGSDPQSQYLTGGGRITFDPHLPTDWNGMRQEEYQPFLQSYPPITSSTSQPPFSTLAHHPARISSNNFLPGSSTNPPPSFYNLKSPHPPPPPPLPPHHGAPIRSNIPGYYKSSLKLWSRGDQNAPPINPSFQPTHQYGPMNSPYPHIPYPGSTTTYPTPPPLASSPVTAFRNYGNST